MLPVVEQKEVSRGSSEHQYLDRLPKNATLVSKLRLRGEIKDGNTADDHFDSSSSVRLDGNL